MKKRIPFLLAILLLSGCSPAVVEIPTSTPAPPTATPPLPTATAVLTSLPNPTITLTPSFVSPTPYPKVSKCTFFDGNLVLPSGESQYANYFGWTSTGEYYIGANFNTKVVFCFLEEGFTGIIREFSRQIDYYAEDVPTQVLNNIGQEDLFQIFPTPDGKYFLFIKSTEPPIVKNLYNYEVYLWNVEKQESSIILDADEEFWGKCRGLLPPEKMIWLDNNLLFVNCATGDDPNYFFIDIQKQQYKNIVTAQA